jgi:hypothetical protein
MLILAACNNGHKADYEVQAELKLIDTLQNRIQTVTSWLDKMPLSEIQERRDIISHNLDFIKTEYNEQNLIADPESMMILDEYKGYGKLYKKVSDSFKAIVMETEELHVQLKTLKESAYSKDYKKETFLEYFNKEKNEVETLYKLSYDILKPMVDTDLDYERTQKQVEEIAEALKQNREKGNSSK